MNKYFQFQVKYIEAPFSEPIDLDIVGDIVVETEYTVTVRYDLPSGEEELKVFEKESGMVFNIR